jgi:hypothetical protein
MGLFPFASTVGSMSNSSAVPGIAMRESRDARHSVRCWPPDGPHSSVRNIRSSVSSLSFSHSSLSASCVGTVQCHAVAQPNYSRSAGGERGPP